MPSAISCSVFCAGTLDGGYGGNGGGGFPSAMVILGGYGGKGGGGFPSATSLFLAEIDPATTTRPTANRVTTSMRFMFVLQV